MITRSLVFLFAQILLNVLVATAQPTLLPAPVRAALMPGAFHIDERTVVLVTDDSVEVQAVARYCADMIGRVSSFTPEVRKHDIAVDPPRNSIVISLRDDDTEVNPEGYVLRVSPKGAQLKAATAAGLFYAVQTFRQLLPARFESAAARDTVKGWDAACCLIVDAPRFPWRGLLLDCSRHFMDVAFIKRSIDLMARFKMNRFHWHLTDDQGWRLQVRSHPALTEIGAWRKQADGMRYGGFYTQDDVREIVAYAAARHVTVVPEIEMPGHTMALLATYPQLSCTGGPFDVPHTWGVFDDVLCVGKSESVEFIEEVLTEVMELFPSEYIHIGGDEVPGTRWMQCEDCRARMDAEGLHNSGELQSWFLSGVEEFLHAHGRKLIGWDEILDGGGLPRATVQSWRGMEGAVTAALSRRHAIVSPTSHAYFDYPLTSIDVETVYGFDPVPRALKPSEAEYILGGECNMWTERAPQHLVESKLYPRILAMAEVLWTPTQQRRYASFEKRLQRLYPRLDSLGIEYGFEAPPVRFEAQPLRSEIRRDDETSTLNVSILAGQKGLRLQYVDPATGETRAGTGSFDVEGRGSVRAWAEKPPRLRSDTAVLRYDLHRGVLGSITLDRSYHPRYSAGGAGALIDGLRGSTRFKDGRWQGYQGGDLTVTVDLGSRFPVSELSAGFLQERGAWIFMPRSVSFSTSEDGLQFVDAGTVLNTASDDEEQTILQDFQLAVEQQTVRYVRMTAENIGTCPPGHPGAGGAAWLFLDEIIVR